MAAKVRINVVSHNINGFSGCKDYLQMKCDDNVNSILCLQEAPPPESGFSTCHCCLPPFPSPSPSSRDGEGEEEEEYCLKRLLIECCCCCLCRVLSSEPEISSNFPKFFEISLETIANIVPIFSIHSQFINSQ